jgi:hypothetical protein
LAIDYILTDFTLAVLIKTCIIESLEAGCADWYVGQATVLTLSWALFGSRSVALPGFRSINAHPGVCKWNLSLLGIDGYKLEDMPKGEINGDIL